MPFDETGKRCYARACQKLDVVPSSYVLTKLSNSKTIDCKHYGLGPRGTMALSIALVVSHQKVSFIRLPVNYIELLIRETKD